MSFGPFSVLPNGLPNLFGLTGQSVPKGLEELVMPGIDILSFLAAANCREVVIAANIPVSTTGVASFAELTVPQGEAWLVLGLTVGYTTLVAEQCRIRAWIARDTAVSPLQAPWRLIGEVSSSLTGAAGVSNCQAVSSGEPFVMYPNDCVTVGIMNITTAGTIQIASRAVIFRFSV